MAKLIKIEKKKSLLSRLVQSISRPDREEESSSLDKQFPFINESMIEPVDEPISTRDAVKIYKQHMLDIGYLVKSELSDFVVSFKEEMKEHEQQLKSEVDWAKDTLAEAKAELKSETKRTKKMLSKSKDEDEKNDFSQDLESVEGEAGSAGEDFNRLSGELAQFKKDKRSFLVNYINTEVHGSDWKKE